jgi:putative salt-induced outer membrane protein YdiY
MRYHITIVFLIISITSNAQILNAESLRKVTDTSGFSGAASLNFALKRNTNDFLTISNNIHVQYKMNNHLVLFKNDINFQKIEGDKFENSGIQHLRYNYKFAPRISWEIFGQAQYNKVSKINFRGLVGSGPRIKLTSSENYKFYLGTLIMYEQEEVSDGVTPLQRDFRGSTYLSFSLYPTDALSFVSTTYYQPKLNEFGDYRISSQSSLLVSVYKNFALKTSYTFTYDAFPAIGIPNSQYDFTTGITYSFD